MRVARQLITERAVAAAHARGGLVSYNHMFGANAATRGRANPHTKEQLLEVLRGLRAFGADLLEVGYRERGGRTLADHLWVWDELGRAGVFLVGVGSSDSHGLDPERRPRPNNFVSWIYADSLDAADLIEGLRAGRVFFGDPTRFDGRIDLRTPDGVGMGQIAVSDRASEEVAVEIEGLEAGDVVRIVRGDGVESHTADARDFAHRLALPLSEAGGFVRVEVHGADGAEKAFSNPIHFVRAPPEAGLPAGRAATRHD